MGVRARTHAHTHIRILYHTFLSIQHFFLRLVALPGIPAFTSHIPSCMSAHNEAITLLSLLYVCGLLNCVWVRARASKSKLVRVC